MQGLYVAFASLLSVQALIMPISKPDGSLDVSSLVNHISLLEQQIENMATVSDILKLEQSLTAKITVSDLSKLEQTMARLEIELQTERMEHKVTQTKLDTALSELNDLSNVKTQLAVLQNQIQSGSLTNRTYVTRLFSDVSTIKAEISQLQSLHNRSSSRGSSVYTRWGRTSCPTGNNMVYKGYAAGSDYTSKGGSPSMLCLPEHPIYSNHTYGFHSDVAFITGTEYRQDHLDMPFAHLYDEDMPCVVCESNRATSIMVPARNACYQGWTLEYSGYLMSSPSTQPRLDFICLDTNAEAIPGGHEVTSGTLVYPVETKCGTLVCPPYVNGRVVTCVVCSK